MLISRDGHIIKNNPDFLRYDSRNTKEYKAMCLVGWILTGDLFYYYEGTRRINDISLSAIDKEIEYVR